MTNCPRAHRALTPQEQKEMEAFFAARAASPAPAQRKKTVCAHWKRGDCALGAACKFDHPKKMKGVDAGKAS